jgi:hypothetical protein
VVISFIILPIWGIRALGDIAVGFVNILFYSAIISRMAMERLPFTEPWENQQRGDNIGWSMIGGILLVGIGFMHWAWMDKPIVLAIWGAIAIILTHLFLKDFDRATWKSVK